MVEERCTYIPLDVYMVDVDVEVLELSSRLEEAQLGSRRVRGQMAGGGRPGHQRLASRRVQLYTTMSSPIPVHNLSRKADREPTPDTPEMAKNANPVEAHRKNRIPVGRSVRTS